MIFAVYVKDTEPFVRQSDLNLAGFSFIILNINNGDKNNNWVTGFSTVPIITRKRI